MVSSSSRSSLVSTRQPKKNRTEETQANGKPLDRLIKVTNDARTPGYMKLVIDLMLEMKEEIQEANRRNKEQTDEVERLRNENLSLKSQLNALRTSNTLPISTSVSDSASLSSSNNDPDLKRSIVIRNLPEPQCTNSVEKVFHDLSAVTEILSCLDVECLPITTYRMGQESIPDAYELLICDIFINSKCIRFMVVYRVPGNTSGLNRLMKTISDFSICSNPCILLGDFNLPSLYSQGNLCESTNNSQTFLSLILTHGFQQLVTSPTRGNAYLDLLFCNDTFLIRNVQIGAPIGGSDHSTVIFDLNLLVLPEIFEYKRDFKNADYSAILEHLANIDWLGSFNMTNTVNEMYETFLAILHHVIELFFPIRKVKLAQLSLPKYLQRMLNHRTLLWKNAVLKQDANSWDKFKEANLRTEKAVNRYNVYLEKKLIESEDKTKFYSKPRHGANTMVP
ncbi:hypothetical protein Y032_0045g1289 [Ancylostoma ceylanicum]|uniref:Endonuclease/exonuclease/phosphatase domain-containing protein n=1 Tax=Ancylostoma ceylanicum TaxID=53326 RepID=A0A016UDB8_9BILA|nr:hypothetical protein Y032_0045g1289 [Ancylostoma ceylanicum]